jgi:hypothetical protein
MDFDPTLWCRGADSFLTVSMLVWASITAGVVADRGATPPAPGVRPLRRARRRRSFPGAPRARSGPGPVRAARQTGRIP